MKFLYIFCTLYNIELMIIFKKLFYRISLTIMRTFCPYLKLEKQSAHYTYVRKIKEKIRELGKYVYGRQLINIV